MEFPFGINFNFIALSMLTKVEIISTSSFTLRPKESRKMKRFSTIRPSLRGKKLSERDSWSKLNTTSS